MSTAAKKKKTRLCELTIQLRMICVKRMAVYLCYRMTIHGMLVLLGIQLYHSIRHPGVSWEKNRRRGYQGSSAPLAPMILSASVEGLIEGANHQERHLCVDAGPGVQQTLQMGQDFKSTVRHCTVTIYCIMQLLMHPA